MLVSSCWLALTRQVFAADLACRSRCDEGTSAGSEELSGFDACSCGLMAGPRMFHGRHVLCTMDAVTLPASGTWASLSTLLTRSENTSGGRSD